MEANWERGSEHVLLSLDEINSRLSPLSTVATSSCLLTEGKANSNYLLDLTSGGKVVLRVHVKDPAAGRLEAAIAKHFGGDPVVPQVLLHDPEQSYSVVEWMPGESMESLVLAGRGDEVLAAAEDIGSTLFRLSQSRLPSAGFLDENLEVREAWPSIGAGLFGYVRFLLDTDLVNDRLAAGLKGEIRRIADEVEPQIPEEPCLVHGDFKASNLLIHEGRLSAVLDWEFAHSGTWVMSVGQLFRHHEQLPDGFEERFARGCGELPRNWRELGQAIDLLSFLDFLNRPASGPTVIAEANRLIARNVASLARTGL